MSWSYFLMSKKKGGTGFPIPPPDSFIRAVDLAEQASRLDLHTGPHGGGNRHALDVSALRAGRLRLGHRIRERLDVLHQLLFGERRLADAGLNDSRLFDAEFDRTALGALHGVDDVHGDGADL